MAVMTEAELFAKEGSLAAEVMLAVLVLFPAVRGLVVMVIVAVALLARLAIVQVTIPLFCEAVPRGLLAEMNEAPAGSTSVTVTLVAGDGPRFVTLRV